jgi:Protein of unknown function (DUF3617)
MRKMILCGAVILPATVLAAASLEPLNVKTGLWQVTMTSKIAALPAPNTSTYKSCLAKEDLNKYPFTDPDENCTWTVLSSTGSKMEADGTCTPEDMGKVGFKMSLEAVDSESIKGTGQLTATGPAGPMNGSYSGTAKWIGATCPADMR